MQVFFSLHSTQLLAFFELMKTHNLRLVENPRILGKKASVALDSSHLPMGSLNAFQSEFEQLFKRRPEDRAPHWGRHVRCHAVEH